MLYDEIQQVLSNQYNVCKKHKERIKKRKSSYAVYNTLQDLLVAEQPSRERKNC